MPLQAVAVVALPVMRNRITMLPSTMVAEREDNLNPIITWLHAIRPRTLLLSLSGVLMGGFLAATAPLFHPLPALFAALTAVLLQILSNLANDYGDFKKGLDDAHRVGPQRALQSGELTEPQLLKGMNVVASLCLLCGAALLLSAKPFVSWKELVLFAVLGLLAIAAALFYTLGRHPYGYRGLGDLFCFLFFGWAAVAGTFYLSTSIRDFTVLLPASAMGFLSNAVLNINNMRDYENDKAKGKNSLVVKIGLDWAYRYHGLLIAGAFACLTLYLVLKHAPVYAYVFWLLFPLFLKDLIGINNKLRMGPLDPFLPRQVIHTFLLTLAYAIPQLF